MIYYLSHIKVCLCGEIDYLFQKQNPESSRIVRVASCTSISDLLTRLSRFTNTKKDAVSHASKVVLPIIKLLEEESSEALWESIVHLLSTIVTLFPAAFHISYDKVSSLRFLKCILFVSKFAHFLALLPKANKGDAGSWSLMMQKLLISINVHLNNFFQGLEDAQRCLYKQIIEHIIKIFMPVETSRLYKQAGVNPLAGCLPTLASIPVWIGLYQALSIVANEGLFTGGFFWIPSLGGPTSIAARQSGSGVSWLFPFVDGHPPLAWGDTAAYLVLPVLLIVSQYVPMEIMKPPQTDDPAQKNTLLVFKFLPLMIGYFALSVPSGLSIYWFTNNVLSTPPTGRAKRSIAQPDDAGERFRQLKEQEKRSKKNKAVAKDTVELLESQSESEEGSDDEEEEVREGALASSTSKPLPDAGQRRSKDRV
ncbi:hypothetical protein Bca52824_034815 [Brassica carinata]|uniref:Uncharacterized protein n=1 Tax=Brassica carinata TaxID=52824 RepID=A0A8X7RZD8_BRACI|nr:hypothetical protein Bca52824_034815 [Brassica carinata]